jgi:hypothetical protein
LGCRGQQPKLHQRALENPLQHLLDRDWPACRETDQLAELRISQVDGAVAVGELLAKQLLHLLLPRIAALGAQQLVRLGIGKGNGGGVGVSDGGGSGHENLLLLIDYGGVREGDQVTGSGSP